MQRLVPGGALSKNCGLSTKLVCLRSPPALPSFQWPSVALPQNWKSELPERLISSRSFLSMLEVSARLMLASISKRI